MHVQTETGTRARFVKGALLAWVPIVLFLTPVIVSIVRTISTTKATGLGAVSGGLSEALVIVGIFAMIATQVSAMLLLFRSFESGHTMRGVLAVLTISASVLTLALMGVIVWMIVRFAR